VVPTKTPVLTAVAGAHAITNNQLKLAGSNGDRNGNNDSNNDK
jgi:hypothetical protein